MAKKRKDKLYKITGLVLGFVLAGLLWRAVNNEMHRIDPEIEQKLASGDYSDEGPEKSLIVILPLYLILLMFFSLAIAPILFPIIGWNIGYLVSRWVTPPEDP